MKRILMIFILFLSATAARGQGSVFTIKPDKPKTGDVIEITYNPQVGADVLKDAKEITLYASQIHENGTSELAEAKMNKEGNIWKGSFTLKDILAKVILFRFDSGDLTDDNYGNCWSVLVCGDKGIPVEKAHYTLGMLYSYGGASAGFPVKADKEKSKFEIDEEGKLYPPKAQEISPLQQFYAEYNANSGNQEALNKLALQLVNYYSQKKKDEREVLNTITLLRLMKKSSLADSLAADYKKSYPSGKFAEEERMNKVYAESDKQKRIDLILGYFKNPEALSQEEKDNYNYMLVQAYIELKKYDDAYDAISKMKVQDGSMYNSLAWACIEKGEELEKAVAWAKKGIDLFRNPNPADKPANMIMKDWKNNLRVSLAYALDTYAYGLYQLGRTAEAEKSYDEAYRLAAAQLSEDFHARYIECLNKNKEYDKAASLAAEFIAMGKTTDKLIAEYKPAFLNNGGTEAQFEKKISAFKEDDMKKIKTKLAGELLNLPAPQFTLKDLDGKEISLASLKGKVVVVDFWATWCGPCKSSFPVLQKVYEKYAGNKDIVILAVNTWENEKGDERIKNVRKFIDENKYTFRVLLDSDERDNAVVTQFGVSGIPTKFIIDRDGKIQFKTVGFMGEKAMMDEMDAQFEMLLNDDYKALIKK